MKFNYIFFLEAHLVIATPLTHATVLPLIAIPSVGVQGAGHPRRRGRRRCRRNSLLLLIITPASLEVLPGHAGRCLVEHDLDLGAGDGPPAPIGVHWTAQPQGEAVPAVRDLDAEGLGLDLHRGLLRPQALHEHRHLPPGVRLEPLVPPRRRGARRGRARRRRLGAAPILAVLGVVDPRRGGPRRALGGDLGWRCALRGDRSLRLGERQLLAGPHAAHVHPLPVHPLAGLELGQALVRLPRRPKIAQRKVRAPAFVGEKGRCVGGALDDSTLPASTRIAAPPKTATQSHARRQAERRYIALVQIQGRQGVLESLLVPPQLLIRRRTALERLGPRGILLDSLHTVIHREYPNIRDLAIAQPPSNSNIGATPVIVRPCTLENRLAADSQSWAARACEA